MPSWDGENSRRTRCLSISKATSWNWRWTYLTADSLIWSLGFPLTFVQCSSSSAHVFAFVRPWMSLANQNDGLRFHAASRSKAYASRDQPAVLLEHSVPSNLVYDYNSIDLSSHTRFCLAFETRDYHSAIITWWPYQEFPELLATVRSNKVVLLLNVIDWIDTHHPSSLSLKFEYSKSSPHPLAVSH